MNNITLNADNEMDLKIADCFRGCEVTFPYDSKGILQGVHDGRFALIDWSHDYDLWMPTEITIDLDTCQPCIYTAMKHGLRVEVEWLCKGHTDPNKAIMHLGDKQHRIALMEILDGSYIKSIKLLDVEGEG